MAQFNPDYKEVQTPDFMGYSRPITQPEGDKSSGIMLKGIGDVFGAAVKGTDMVIKQDIDDSVYAQVDAERNAYTKALVDTRNAVSMQPGLSSGTASTARATAAEGQAMNILTASEDSLPRDVSDVGGYAQTLNDAYAAGKISQTYYYARLQNIATSLRSKYPGYREYIDKQISQVTGVNPANAVVTQLLSDINKSQTGKDDEFKKGLALLEKHIGDPGAVGIQQQFMNGQIGYNEVFQWAAKRSSQKADLEYRSALRADEKGTRDEQKANAEVDGQTMAAQHVSNYVENLQITAGANTPQKIADIVTQAQNGTLKLTTEQAQQLGMQLRSYRTAAYNTLWKEFNQKDRAGKSLVTRVGGADAAKKIINDNLVMLDNISDDIYNEKWGTAFASMNASKGITADTKYGLQKDGGIGQFLNIQGAVKEIGGDQYSQQVFTHYLKKGFDPAMTTYLTQNAGKLITQPDLRITGTPNTLKKAVEDGLDKKINSPQLYNAYIDQITDIAKPGTPDAVKMNLVTAAFSPGNVGILAKFPKDTNDPVTGRYIPGRQAVFNRLTSAAITDEIYKLSQKGQPQLWTDYKNWAEQEFGLQLFNGHIKDLNDFQVRTDRMGNPEVKLQWNSTTHQWSMRLNDSGSVDYAGVQNMKRTIDRLNAGIRSISNIAQIEGTDVDAYVLNLMISQGLDPTKGNVQGIPEQMMRSIMSSKPQDYSAQGQPEKKPFFSITRGK